MLRRDLSARRDAMTAYFWRCVSALLPPALATPCDAAGSYDHKAISGDSGPAWKHCRDTGHPTVTSMREWGEAA